MKSKTVKSDHENLFISMGLDTDECIHDFHKLHIDKQAQKYSDLLEACMNTDWSLKKKIAFAFLEGRFAEFYSFRKVAQSIIDRVMPSKAVMDAQEEVANVSTPN